MTDKELAMLLTESLDNRIARAEAAPVTRVDENRMPPAEAVSGSLIRAVPARQLRWKGVAAAVLVVAMLGGIGLTASKLIDRKSPSLPADSGQVEETQTDPEKTAQVTEPIDPAELPQVSYDADSRTIRISGTTGYDRLDLSPYLDDALNLEVEDDRFQFRASIYMLRDMDEIDDLAADLPRCLERMDRSLDYIANYIAAVAPNEEIAAQTRKPVKITMPRTVNCRNYDEYIALDLGSTTLERLSLLYARALLNPRYLNWYSMGYYFWFFYYQDPYSFQLLHFFPDENFDYFYHQDYFRVGGTEESTPENMKLLIDTAAWYNLVHGHDWDGLEGECSPIKEWSSFDGDPELEGNDLCITEAISLLNYLAEQYGHDKVAAFCFETCSFEEAFGTDFATARAAWEQSLMDRFGDGSETDPTDPAELPQVSYDAGSHTVRITGTTGYDHLDLSPYLDDARYLEVEDDRFQFSNSISALRNMFDDLAVDLPDYLNRMDRSFDLIADYIVSVAPNEEIAAQTRKPIQILMRNGTYRVSDDHISLYMGEKYRRYGILYAGALLNPKRESWYETGYTNWIGFCVDPYNYVNVGFSLDEYRDYYYIRDYFRLGGTEDPLDLNNQALVFDACAWYNLVHGRDWGGNTSECCPIKEWYGFNGDPELEGNDLCGQEAVSLINYLANQYGEKQVAAFCFETCSFEEAFGTDFATARAAWEQSLMDRFGDGSENP